MDTMYEFKTRVSALVPLARALYEKGEHHGDEISERRTGVPVSNPGEIHDAISGLEGDSDLLSASTKVYDTAMSSLTADQIVAVMKGLGGYAELPVLEKTADMSIPSQVATESLALICKREHDSRGWEGVSDAVYDALNRSCRAHKLPAVSAGDHECCVHTGDFGDTAVGIHIHAALEHGYTHSTDVSSQSTGLSDTPTTDVRMPDTDLTDAGRETTASPARDMTAGAGEPTASPARDMTAGAGEPTASPARDMTAGAFDDPLSTGDVDPGTIFIGDTSTISSTAFGEDAGSIFGGDTGAVFVGDVATAADTPTVPSTVFVGDVSSASAGLVDADPGLGDESTIPFAGREISAVTSPAEDVSDSREEAAGENRFESRLVTADFIPERFPEPDWLRSEVTTDKLFPEPDWIRSEDEGVTEHDKVWRRTGSSVLTADHFPMTETRVSEQDIQDMIELSRKLGEEDDEEFNRRLVAGGDTLTVFEQFIRSEDPELMTEARAALFTGEHMTTAESYSMLRALPVFSYKSRGTSVVSVQEVFVMKPGQTLEGFLYNPVYQTINNLTTGGIMFHRIYTAKWINTIGFIDVLEKEISEHVVNTPGISDRDKAMALARVLWSWFNYCNFQTPKFWDNTFTFVSRIIKSDDSRRAEDVASACTAAVLLVFKIIAMCYGAVTSDSPVVRSYPLYKEATGDLLSLFPHIMRGRGASFARRSGGRSIFDGGLESRDEMVKTISRLSLDPPTAVKIWRTIVGARLLPPGSRRSVETVMDIIHLFGLPVRDTMPPRLSPASYSKYGTSPTAITILSALAAEFSEAYSESDAAETIAGEPGAPSFDDMETEGTGDGGDMETEDTDAAGGVTLGSDNIVDFFERYASGDVPPGGGVDRSAIGDSGASSSPGGMETEGTDAGGVTSGSDDDDSEEYIESLERFKELSQNMEKSETEKKEFRLLRSVIAKREGISLTKVTLTIDELLRKYRGITTASKAVGWAVAPGGDDGVKIEFGA
jgi:hypothetical protein